MKAAKIKQTLLFFESSIFLIFFSKLTIPLSGYAYLWATQTTDPIFACVCKMPHNRSHWWNVILPLFDLSRCLLLFLLFEALGEDRSPAAAKCNALNQWYHPGVRAVPMPPCSVGPGLCWAIFLTHPKASRSASTGRPSSLANKANSLLLQRALKSTLKKMLNKISFHRRLDRQREVTGLRPLSSPVTELAPERSHPGFWRGTEFTKQQ